MPKTLPTVRRRRALFAACLAFAGCGEAVKPEAHKPIRSAFAPEPRGQEYAVQHGGRVLFWIADERPPAYGTVVWLWGYHPAIHADGGGTFGFDSVSWHGGEL